MLNVIIFEYITKMILSLLQILIIRPYKKIASEMPVPHSLGKSFQHHEICETVKGLDTFSAVSVVKKLQIMFK